jgi:hypothetical protein
MLVRLPPASVFVVGVRGDLTVGVPGGPAQAGVGGVGHRGDVAVPVVGFVRRMRSMIKSGDVQPGEYASPRR